jgi:hypothetical protein
MQIVFELLDQPTEEICTAFLATPFRLFDKWHRDPDYYCKTRLSMLELLYRQTEEHARRLYAMKLHTVTASALLISALLATPANAGPEEWRFPLAGRGGAAPRGARQRGLDHLDAAADDRR